MSSVRITLALTLLAGCSAAPSAARCPDHAKSAQSSTGEAPGTDKATSHPKQRRSTKDETDAVAWLERKLLARETIYTIDSGNCVAWKPRWQEEPIKRVHLVHEEQGLSGHIFVRRIIFDIASEKSIVVRSIAQRHWKREGSDWIEQPLNWSLPLGAHWPRLVLDGRAIAMSRDWWWFGSHTDCKLDLESGKPHTFERSIRFTKDDWESWPQ